MTDSFVCRGEEWTGDPKNGPAGDKEQVYDGPPGMEPDGIIESNWDEVKILIQ